MGKENYLPTRAHELAYQRLVELARRQSAPIGYSPIFQIMGLKASPRAAGLAGRLLDDINRHTHATGKPMLSALVVNQDDKMPGSGFFDLAVEFGELPIGASYDEKKAFWVAELQRVYDARW